MAINWENIEGYRDDMTAEEKLNLLNSVSDTAAAQTAGASAAQAAAQPEAEKPPVEVPKAEKPSSGFVSKAQYDKLASEHAALKKQHRATMSEEERKEADRQAEQEALRAELEELRHDRKVAGYKANYLAMGYDEALASESAEALATGDVDTVFANIRKYVDGLEKQLRSKILKETPRTAAGEDPDVKKNYENMLKKSMGL